MGTFMSVDTSLDSSKRRSLKRWCAKNCYGNDKNFNWVFLVKICCLTCLTSGIPGKFNIEFYGSSRQSFKNEKKSVLARIWTEVPTLHEWHANQLHHQSHNKSFFRFRWFFLLFQRFIENFTWIRIFLKNIFPDRKTFTRNYKSNFFTTNKLEKRYWTTSFWIASYDKFLNSMIILILIISYTLMFYRNFELIFGFMALKRAPICGWNVCLSFFLRIFTSNSDTFNQIK